MTLLNTRRLALSLFIASTAWVAAIPAQAQGHGHEDHMKPHMAKKMEKYQSDLKGKLRLTPEQEGAWRAFVDSSKHPAKMQMHHSNREAMAKLTTPERLDKMKAEHDARHQTMQAHMKQREDATREFYKKLSAEQQKVFDAESLHGPEHKMGNKGKHD